MRYSVALFLLALYILFTSFQCEDCDFFETLPGLNLVVNREDDGATYAVGDTVWLSANFSAAVPNTDLTIAEGGGLIVSRLFSFVPGNDTLFNARGDFSTQVTAGELQPTAVSTDESALVVRFFCSGGACAFRQGFIPEAPGNYLLEVRGGGVDVLSPTIDICNTPNFSTTLLNGPDNRAESELTLPAPVGDGILRTVDAFEAGLLVIAVQ